MKWIAEYEIIDLIRSVNGYTGNISVIKPLKTQEFFDDEFMKSFKKAIENEYNAVFDDESGDINASSNIIEIVDHINNKNGLNELTIRKEFEDVCKKDPKRIMLRFDSVEITYEEAYNTVIEYANGLIDQGVRKGTGVAILLDNCMEYILLYFALFYVGAVPVPINIRWVNHEIKNVLKDSEVEYAISQESSGRVKFYEPINELIQETGQIKKVFYIGNNFYEERGIELSKIRKETNPYGFEEICSKDIAMISYTSGTTGFPKGAVLGQYEILKTSINISELVLRDVVSLSIAPLYSAQGFLSLLMNFAKEDTFEMLSTYNPNEIIKVISKEKVDFIHTQPTMWTLMLNCKLMNFARFDNMKKVVVSGSLCTPELAKRIEKKIGCRVINIYGLLEGTSAVTTTREDDSDEIRYNTVGRPIPGVLIKIIDQEGNEVPKGEIGELAVKGLLMRGYYNNPEITGNVIDQEGWLHTGDLAKYYDDENISIVGRCKDMIIRGGFNVYPSDIEEIISEIQEVQTVAVVGKENEVLGEEIVAFVVPKAGAELDKNYISRYTFEHLANYKQPDKIYLINEMPIILAGKIDKKQLIKWLNEGIPAEKQILFM